jgi:hypothetical protein
VLGSQPDRNLSGRFVIKRSGRLEDQLGRYERLQGRINRTIVE